MSIVLAWLDGHPRSQQPLQFEVEIFAVAHDLSIGPPARLVIEAPIGRA